MKLPSTQAYESAQKRLRFCEERLAALRAGADERAREVSDLKDQAVKLELEINRAARDADEKALAKLEPREQELQATIARKQRILDARDDDVEQEHCRQVLLAEREVMDAWREWLNAFERLQIDAAIQAAGKHLALAHRAASLASSGAVGNITEYVARRHPETFSVRLQAVEADASEMPVPFDAPRSKAQIPNELRVRFEQGSLRRAINPATDAHFTEELLPAVSG